VKTTWKPTKGGHGELDAADRNRLPDEAFARSRRLKQRKDAAHGTASLVAHLHSRGSTRCKDVSDE
jgi:hypothetical protein